MSASAAVWNGRFGAFGIVSVTLGSLRRWRKVCQKLVVKSNLLPGCSGGRGRGGGREDHAACVRCPVAAGLHLGALRPPPHSGNGSLRPPPRPRPPEQPGPWRSFIGASDQDGAGFRGGG